MEKCGMPVLVGDDQTVNLQSLGILIVDDEPLVVKLLSRQLLAAGCRIWCAGSAEEAIALARREDLDVIMLDLVLPGISGYSAINSLKNESDAAILVMSGNVDSEIEKDVMILGADGLIGKPYEFQELASILYEMTSRRENAEHHLSHFAFDRGRDC